MKRFLVTATAIVTLVNVVDAKAKAAPHAEVKHDDHHEDAKHHDDHKTEHHSGSGADHHDDKHHKSGSESWDQATKTAEHGAG